MISYAGTPHCYGEHGNLDDDTILGRGPSGSKLPRARGYTTQEVLELPSPLKSEKEPYDNIAAIKSGQQSDENSYESFDGDNFTWEDINPLEEAD